MYFFQINKPV